MSQYGKTFVKAGVAGWSRGALLQTFSGPVIAQEK